MTTFVTAAAGAAAPAGPSAGEVGRSTPFSSVRCGESSGEYRACARCDVNNWPDYDRYGAWVGTVSTATRDSGDRAFNRGYRTR